MGDEEIAAHFVKDSGGPNPYYKCVKCGVLEPGLREYLVAHVESCPSSSKMYSKEFPNERPVAEGL